MLRTAQRQSQLARGRAWRALLPDAFGRRCRIGHGVHLQGPSALRLGDGVIVANGCMLAAVPRPDGAPAISVGSRTFFNIGAVVASFGPGIDIGEDVLFGPHTCVVDADHAFDDPTRSVARQGMSPGAPVIVGAGSWIATGAVLLGGTTLAPGTVVAAGAVVRGCFPRRSMIGGVPARVLRDLPDRGSHHEC